MTLLANILRSAVMVQKTVAAISATVVITIGVYDYLRKRK